MRTYSIVSAETQKVVLSVLPLFHIYGFNGILNSTMQQGMQMVSIPKFTPEDYISCVIKYKVTAKHALGFIQLQ
jgi:acyl-CoA synthetase (AMP-forming)/AMP-acid ligase II